MPDNYRVSVSVPNVPSNCVNLINDLIAEIEKAHGNLQKSAGQVQTFMGQARGAVQNVALVSQGQAAQALVDTWLYTQADGNHSHEGITGVASHLGDLTGKITPHLHALKDGMTAIETVIAQGGQVMVGEAGFFEGQIADFTNALNNIGMALEAAAALINSVSGNIPIACATGFTPGGSHPVFADTSFDPHNDTGRMNMADQSGGGGGGSNLPATTEESVTKKLNDYLLNSDHPVGGSKATWFKNALGFTRANAGDLARQIVFDPSKAIETGVTQYGTKYNEVISITGANGRTIDVMFAWIKNNDGVVRLVTGFPGD